MTARTSLIASLIATLAVVAACAQGDADDGSGGAPDAAVSGGPDAPLGGIPDAPLGFPDGANTFPDANNTFPDANTTGPVDAAPAADAGPQPDGAVLGMACIEAQSQSNSDACAGAIDLTATATTGGALVYGDTTLYTNDLEPVSSCTGGFGLDGEDAMYKVDATAGQTISATVTPADTTFDVGMYILNSCASADPCLAGVDAVAGTGAESLSYVVPTTGTYYIIVDSYIPGESGCYALQVGVQ